MKIKFLTVVIFSFVCSLAMAADPIKIASMTDAECSRLVKEVLPVWENEPSKLNEVQAMRRLLEYQKPCTALNYYKKVGIKMPNVQSIK